MWALEAASGRDPDEVAVVFLLQAIISDFVLNVQDLLDLNKLVSNDIFAILSSYGVEAARRAIVQEV